MESSKIFFLAGAVFVEFKELQSQVQIKGISGILFSAIHLSYRNNNKMIKILPFQLSRERACSHSSSSSTSTPAPSPPTSSDLFNLLTRTSLLSFHFDPPPITGFGPSSFFAGVFCHRQHPRYQSGAVLWRDTVTVGARPSWLPYSLAGFMMKIAAPGSGRALAPALPPSDTRGIFKVAVSAIFVYRSGTQGALSVPF